MNTTHVRLFWKLALIVCLTASGAPALHAGPDQPDRAPAKKDPGESDTAKAKKYFARAQKLFALGRFKQALASYENAYESKPLPEFLFNIGQCHRNLGDYKSAIFSFRKYLKLKPDAKNRKAVTKLIRELEDEIARADEKLERDRKREVVKPPPPPKKKKPTKTGAFYTRWWFWTGVATVAAAGTATAIVVGDQGGIPSSDLGNVEFAR